MEPDRPGPSWATMSQQPKLHILRKALSCAHCVYLVYGRGILVRWMSICVMVRWGSGAMERMEDDEAVSRRRTTQHSFCTTTWTGARITGSDDTYSLLEPASWEQEEVGSGVISWLVVRKQQEERLGRQPGLSSTRTGHVPCEALHMCKATSSKDFRPSIWWDIWSHWTYPSNLNLENCLVCTNSLHPSVSVLLCSLWAIMMTITITLTYFNILLLNKNIKHS